MKKYIPYLLFCLGVLSIAFIRNERINIDYHYQRSASDYNAYTVFLTNQGKTPSYEFELVSNKPLDKINSITIKQQEKTYKINYELVKTAFLSDDRSLNGITAKVNLDKFFSTAKTCDGIVIFNVADGNKIELPILPCKIREASKN